MQDFKSITDSRISSFRHKLKEKDLDGALITKRENYIYLSGFTGTSAVLVITQKEAVLVTDFRYVTQASQQAPSFKIEQYTGSMLAALETMIKKFSLSRIGFEEEVVSYKAYTEYKSKFGKTELVPLEGVIERLRAVKSSYELEIIKEAVKIADRAFDHILQYIKPGVSEIEIASELEHFIKKQGAKGTSFDTIVASGERASMPHGVASEKKVSNGDVITMDFGALYKEYCSDMTRTVFLGQPREELKKIYNIVLEAQLEAIEGAHAGKTGREIDRIARDIIYSNGYNNNFGHGLGHCVGLEIHEEPRLSPMGNIQMENGMTVTVEPGIYVEGLGGVRIEDIILINDDKPLILTSSPKEMIIL
ncbi:MAG: Xaa-Pro peptidase family protein [Bacillota bacterium]|nr:Xaa-Pro peptidase family protein [Bacillota bacterium]